MKTGTTNNDGVAVLALLVGTVAAGVLNPIGPALFSFGRYYDLGREEAAAGLVEGDVVAKDGRGTPFHVSSLASGFSVAGAYDGFADLGPDGLAVSISTAALRTRPDMRDGNELAGIKVELGRSTTTSWHTFRSAPLHEVDRSLSPGESFSLDGFDVVIPDVTREDLDGAWLVITHELSVAAVEPGGYSGPAWTYAHGDRSFLASLERVRSPRAMNHLSGGPR